MSHVEALVCDSCGRRYAPDDVAGSCPAHDDPEGALDVRYDYEAIRKRIEEYGGIPDAPTDIWDFSPFLPITDADPVSLGAGGTPLHDAPTLSDRIDARIRIKDETGNPTGSIKDRGAAVAVTAARAAGHGVVACASTGNAAASLAAYAARAGLNCRIFVPSDLPEAKAVQPRIYGAKVMTVDGTYAAAYERCRQLSAERSWYNCSAGLTPYVGEGMRTLGFELALEAPDADWVVVPMGNGCTLAALWKGLREFERLGQLAETPHILGVQASGASAIFDTYVPVYDGTSTEGSPVTGTMADSIDVRRPRSAARACRALEESDGAAVVVDDDAIGRAQRLLGDSEGLFVEPASAAAVAGADRARGRGIVDGDDSVVVVATGSGLKDTATTERVLENVQSVPSERDDGRDR